MRLLPPMVQEPCLTETQCIGRVHRLHVDAGDRRSSFVKRGRFLAAAIVAAREPALTFENPLTSQLKLPSAA